MLYKVEGENLKLAVLLAIHSILSDFNFGFDVRNNIAWLVRINLSVGIVVQSRASDSNASETKVEVIASLTFVAVIRFWL